MKKDIWFNLIPVGLLFAALLFPFMALTGCGEQKTKALLTEEETLRLQTVSEAFFFCGNVDMSNAETKVFTFNFGSDVATWEQPIDTSDRMKMILTTLTDREDGYCPEGVYLVLDPARIEAADEEAYRSVITEFGTAHPDSSVVLFVMPASLKQLAALPDKDSEHLLTSCKEWIDAVDALANGKVYYTGAEMWIIANEDNFDNGQLNDDVSGTLFPMCFADDKFRIEASTVEEYLDILRQEIREEREHPAVYPDLSDYDIVFWGDSIIGNFRDSTSIPGVVHSFSGARIYNIAQGGTCAHGKVDDPQCFGGVVTVFLGGDPEAYPEGKPYRESFEQYLKDDHEGRKLAFVINYGLNDYFDGELITDPEDPLNTDTFEGAMRSGVLRIREAYPQAVIIVATPNFVTMFGNGEEPQSDYGGTLADYAEAVRRVCRETSVFCLDNHAELGLTAENAYVMVGDGVHLNGTGRMIVAQRIIYTLASYVQ